MTTIRKTKKPKDNDAEWLRSHYCDPHTMRRLRLIARRLERQTLPKDVRRVLDAVKEMVDGSGTLADVYPAWEIHERAEKRRRSR